MVVLRALLPAVHFPGLRDPLELVRPALGHVLQANRAGTHPQPSKRFRFRLQTVPFLYGCSLNTYTAQILSCFQVKLRWLLLIRVE